MPKKFWMVWVNDTPTTKYRHTSYASASIEADRLAMMQSNIGKKVYILEALDYRMVELPPIVRTKL